MTMPAPAPSTPLRSPRWTLRLGAVALGLALAACGPASDTEAPAGDVAGTPVPMAHATTFSVTDLGEGVRVVDMRASVSSWGGAADGPEQQARLALVPLAVEVPALTGPLAGATVVRTPVERVAVNYTPFEAMLSVLGVADRLVAVGGTTSYDDAVYARVASGELPQIGYGWHIPPAIDVLATTEADVLLMALADLGHAEAIPRIEAMGIPVVPMFLDAEPHYLGRVDYVRLVGMLTDREAEADSFVTMVTAEVDRLTALAASQPTRSLMWAWYSGGDRWGAAVRNAEARLLRDANGRLALEQPDDPRLDARMEVGTERILADAADVACWVQDSHGEPYRNEAVLQRLRAWREGCVYAATGQTKPRRNAYDFYEMGAIRPDYLLGDLVKMLHPEVRPEPFRYLVPAGPEAAALLPAAP
ncbi:MAG: ABC transporter substrate-binding protein [Bacteroidota bacterium]